MSAPITTGLKRVVAASMAGTVVEWYEFFLYGTAATLVFSKVFFSETTSELNAIFLAFATYAVGFVARPVGGVVFGHFGDKYGRKKLLQFCLLLVGAATFLMGCLPTFGQIGYWAPGLLVALRFIQGFAVGGEWGGAVLLVAEHSPNKQRGFWASWPQAGVPVGNLLATVVLLVLTGTLSDAAFLSWGWRVAFWLSAVVVLIGYYIRTKVTDAPIFVEAQQEAERIKATSCQRHRGAEALPAWRLHRDGAALRREHHVLPGGHLLHHVPEGAGGRRHQLDPAGTCSSRTRCTSSSSRWSGTCPTASGVVPCTWSARSSARTWGFFAFPMMNSGNYVVITAAVTLGLVIHAFMYAPQPAIMAEMFPTRMRYSGVSLGYQVTSIVAGSLAPLIAVKLLDIYDSSVPIAIYLAVACAITLVAVLFTRETNGIDLKSLDVADAEELAAERAGRGRMTDLTGRTALVTGGASGIGAACARELAGRGATVTVADVDEVAAKTLADEIGGNAWAVDLLDVGALEELRLETDVLVNNAGVQSIDPIVDFSPERFRVDARA